MAILSTQGYRIKIFGTNKQRAALVWVESQKREAIRTARRLVRKRGAGSSASVFTDEREPALIYQCHAHTWRTGGQLHVDGDEL